MAVTAKIYGLAMVSAFNKEIDLDSDDVQVMLTTNAYTPNQDTHRYKSDITNEITGTGYTAGGADLTSEVVTYDAGSNTLKFDANDVSWTSATITARYAIVYVNTGVAGTSPLIGYVDFGSDVSVTGGTLTVQWNAAGIATVTVA